MGKARPAMALTPKGRLYLLMTRLLDAWETYPPAEQTAILAALGPWTACAARASTAPRPAGTPPRASGPPAGILRLPRRSSTRTA